ncbi:hypothetical protein J0676_05935 [Vibrio sp. Vb2880]|uniref:hypothetical protein n=1 Tax=Vibrio sp. Vb2880 TaxID=2816076 RepID=UPI001A8FB768|nr:hypothetical protein [Vibrio sp. Vb2880]MBO0213019.1 hypothetical protein [Vibrio sp. Vb2880]
MNLTEIINNSLMQSLLLSPLMGVVFAAIFSGLTSAPKGSNATSVLVTRTVYRERVIYRNGGGGKHKSNSSDDAMGVGIAAFGAMCFVVWKYATMYDQILAILCIATLTIISFAFTTIVISLIKGQYTSTDWYMYTLFPLAALFMCLYLVFFAFNSFDPRIQEEALKANVVDFYFKRLNEYGRNFMMAHIIGIVSMVFTLLATMLAQIHYLSLMNLRGAENSEGFWFWLAKLTSAMSRKRWLVGMIILLVMSYICLEPNLVATWLTNRTK